MAKAKTYKEILDSINRIAQKRGISGMQKDARAFFQEKIESMAKKITGSKLVRERPDRLRNTSQMTVGRMYMYFYDPKHKKKLPYYDRFPLILMLHEYDDGFLGINFHYLSPYARSLLLARLAETANSTRYDDRTKMLVTYGILKSAVKLKMFRPALKRYLTTHMRSRAVLVPADEWLPTVFLPIADFAKKSQEYVWADSARKVREYDARTAKKGRKGKKVSKSKTGKVKRTVKKKARKK